VVRVVIARARVYIVGIFHFAKKAQAVNLTNFWPIIIVIGIAAIMFWTFSQRRRPKPTTDDLNDLCNYFYYVSQTRAFPTVDLGGVVTPKKNEFGLINRRANLYELRAHRQSVGVSFRVAKGVYVGKRAYVSKDHLDRTAVGTVILTNQRLVFISVSKTVTVQISNIIELDPENETVG
jgi:hypothetical protein